MLQAVYLSTTGVYGETAAGQIIDEDSPVSPTRIGPCIAVAAENWLSSIQIKAPSVHVLRLAGIYGPGRIPLIQQIRTGQPLEVPKSGLLNLIHLRDIAPAIEWLFATQPARKMYLLSDGHAVERHQFYSYFAELNNCLPPQFVPADQFSTKARRATDKRIDPSRFWKDSELTAIHPSYRSGLRDI
jgi:nucleoside-diphosphate-sugar epimerase